jgi:hypothetical protein
MSREILDSALIESSDVLLAAIGFIATAALIATLAVILWMLT